MKASHCATGQSLANERMAIAIGKHMLHERLRPYTTRPWRLGGWNMDLKIDNGFLWGLRLNMQVRHFSGRTVGFRGGINGDVQREQEEPAEREGSVHPGPNKLGKLSAKDEKGLVGIRKTTQRCKHVKGKFSSMLTLSR